MKNAWEPPEDLPEGELEEVASDELDAMLAERALEALLSDEEETVATNPSAETDDEEDSEASPSDDEESAEGASDAEETED